MFIPVQTIVLDTSTLGASLPTTPYNIGALLTSLHLGFPDGIQPQVVVRAKLADCIIRQGLDAASSIPVAAAASNLWPIGQFIAETNFAPSLDLTKNQNFVSVLSLDGATNTKVYIIVGYGEKI